MAINLKPLPRVATIGLKAVGDIPWSWWGQAAEPFPVVHPPWRVPDEGAHRSGPGGISVLITVRVGAGTSSRCAGGEMRRHTQVKRGRFSDENQSPVFILLFPGTGGHHQDPGPGGTSENWVRK